MFKKNFKAIVLDCFVLCFFTVANYPIIISPVPLIRYADHQRLAEKVSPPPLPWVKKLITPPFSFPRPPPPPPPILMASPLYLLNFGNMYLHICFFRRPCSLVNIYKSRSQEH